MKHPCMIIDAGILLEYQNDINPSTYLFYLLSVLIGFLLYFLFIVNLAELIQQNISGGTLPTP